MHINGGGERDGRRRLKKTHVSYRPRNSNSNKKKLLTGMHVQTFGLILPNGSPAQVKRPCRRQNNVMKRLKFLF